MDPNCIPGGILPGMGSGILGLEMPLHHQQQQQHHHPHEQMVAFVPHDTDPHSLSQKTLKQQAYPYTTKGKQQQPPLSDDDEPGFTWDDVAGDARKRLSPWHRMKWTDNMVRLLITAVFYIEDDGGCEANDPSGTGKKKPGGLLQKKGKWKSVSVAMMEKGFYVSPQQCEDKFNDLNKRYKRVNEILGKGTACKVVENQSLLETMDQISPKMKEEVRKLLNSKHLFFREMCAYHNSCGGGTAGTHHSSEAVVEAHHPQQPQRCFDSSESTFAAANSKVKLDTEGIKMGRGVNREEEEAGSEFEDDDDDDDEDDEEDEEEEEMEGGGSDPSDHKGGQEEEEDDYKLRSKKRQRKGMVPSSPTSLPSPAMQELRLELMNVVQDGTKLALEKRQWMRVRSMQLEEKRVSYQCQSLELEKERVKWVQFSGKKGREMERMKLRNERMMLENERMVLLLRRKELELMDLQQEQQHSSNKRPDPSSITG